MKIVYMGTPDFAVPPLAALVKNRIRGYGSCNAAG